MEPMLATAGALSALVAGVTGSLHCALMCGPLACASPAVSGAERRAAAIAWHLGRIIAYTMVGLLLGALGKGASSGLQLTVTPVLPWLMAAGLLITALDLGRHARPLPFVGSISKGLLRLGLKMSGRTRGFLLGAATPFLPCGLLYGLFLAAIATGTPWGGAAVMGAFSLGAIPALVALQLGAHRLTISPRLVQVARRVVPLTAAGVLIARALTTSPESPRCH